MYENRKIINKNYSDNKCYVYFYLHAITTIYNIHLSYAFIIIFENIINYIMAK